MRLETVIFIIRLYVYNFRYTFECKKWLAKDRDDGVIRRNLEPCSRLAIISPTALIRNNISRRLFDDHIWLSLTHRPTKSIFTRAQRLGVCMATLFLAMITNAMFYKSADDASTSSGTGVTIGPVTINLQQIFISLETSLIVIPPIVIVTMIFSKRSEEESTRSETVQQKLPYWSLYIAWTLVFLSVAVSTFFTILYSFQWGREKSTTWLVTFLLSFFESAIIIQPAKVSTASLLVYNR